MLEPLMTNTHIKRIPLPQRYLFGTRVASTDHTTRAVELYYETTRTTRDNKQQQQQQRQRIIAQQTRIERAKTINSRTTKTIFL
jgi:hypothetical protein